MSGPGTSRAGRWLLVVAGVVVVGTVVAAFFVMDPPARQRAERLDGIRVADLERLKGRIESHALVHGQLPERLSVVSGVPGDAIVDPATGRPYQYEVTGEHSYRLCAIFEAAVEGPRTVVAIDDGWRHGEGRHCFDLAVDAGD